MAAADLDQAWVDALAKASQSIEPAVAASAIVELTIGKTKRAALQITDGRITGSADEAAGEVEPEVSIPVTGAQLASFCDGTESMSKAFMRGDLKPVGSTGALLPLFALFDDPAFVEALSD
ncbi:MAG: hypothetical protein AAFO29_25925 [Actinomycetota bacterium]